MPRNGSGVFTLAQPPFVPNTVISSAQVNSDLSDIATALTDSLARDSQGGMTDAFLAIDGTVGAPGISFLADPNTGLRRVGADQLAIVAGGSDALTISGTAATFASGINLDVTGVLAITGTQTIASTAAGTLLTLISTDAGALSGPDVVFDRNSASPAANDVISSLILRGRDSGAGVEDYVTLIGQILDPTAASEDSRLLIRTRRAGANNDWSIGNGSLWYSSVVTQPSNAGEINATGLYIDGQPVGQTITFSADKGGAGADTLTSGVFVQITFGTENWDIGGAYAANAWTPPAGKYQIIIAVEISATNGVANENISLSLRKNGVGHRVFNFSRTGTAGLSVGETAIVDANGTDVFTVFVQKSGAGNGATGTTATLNYFQGTAL